jgi:hypothetical protein
MLVRVELPFTDTKREGQLYIDKCDDDRGPVLGPAAEMLVRRRHEWQLLTVTHCNIRNLGISRAHSLVRKKN